jgi:hypothetical protein
MLAVLALIDRRRLERGQVRVVARSRPSRWRPNLQLDCATGIASPRRWKTLSWSPRRGGTGEVGSSAGQARKKAAPKSGLLLDNSVVSGD